MPKNQPCGLAAASKTQAQPLPAAELEIAEWLAGDGVGVSKPRLISPKLIQSGPASRYKPKV